ncbi:MAG TPA: ribosome small subunit-dependent GTPase A, partial [Chitinophagaceae bacterium]|nr:ribosome small subunit-dependent GTPase A [Chitinophagaceae bacterium]
LILFNKADQFTAGDLEKLDRIMTVYQQVGYEILICSAITGQGLEALQSRLSGSTTLFAGHSGSGKSSLINLLLPGTDQKTGRISGWSGKGVHTTTFAEMFDLPGSGKVIDTPGIREYGLVDLAPAEVSHYFPEMLDFLSGCRFSNCLHVEEPGCEVKKALEEGRISPERYVSYLSILESLV